ncbi:glycosyltransferase family 39 protein [Candidatus Shapirobacteria bacterium]|nr:glycosyltransferase family 39 protein [Candidatus Shapirobacteria bacterium]
MIKNYKLKILNSSAILIIFLLALTLRLYGLDWDQGQHLHPDERFLTMVVNDIKLPTSLAQYFDTKSSPLNPYNYPNYQFFVYGTFPIFLTKLVAVLLHLDDYGHIQLVGRALSAIFDSFNIFILYWLSLKLFKNKYLQFLPSLLYSFTVLPLQLSHFFAVDTFLTTFILACFTALAYSQFALAGIFFGIALACKISAIYFIPIIGIYLIYFFFSKKDFMGFILKSLILLLISLLVFRLFQPYSFIGPIKINPQFISNIKDLQAMSGSNSTFPPAVQWISKVPLLNSLKNIVIWGLGIPVTLLFFLGLIKIKIKQTSPFIYLSLVWILILYFYQGSQFAHTIRYFLPIYPFIILVVVYFSKFLNSKFLNLLVLCHLAFGIIFLNIYSHPHSRVQASNWIYDNLPVGSNITNEYWDDPLPLYLPNRDPYVYSGSMLSLYDPDSPEKWQKLDPIINSTDYMIMSSNRLWGSIPLVPKMYPEASVFYQNLFAQKLSFEKLIEINSYPGITLSFLKKCYYLGLSNFPGIQNSWFTIDPNCNYPGIYLRDDTAEEAFTVYDHPKVLIFKNNK